MTDIQENSHKYIFPAGRQITGSFPQTPSLLGSEVASWVRPPCLINKQLIVLQEPLYQDCTQLQPDSTQV